MSNHVSHSALPYPVKNARFTIPVPYLDGTGTPTDPTTPDTELSKDGGAFADCVEEVTTISGGNGSGYITLSGAETDCALLIVCAKVASGPKPTILYGTPRVLAIVSSGTLSAGSAGGGTLGTILPYDVTGCFIRTTGGTGGGGTGGANNQARKIVTYNTTSGAFTIAPNWEVNPNGTTTYDVLLPEGVTLGMLRSVPLTVAQTADAVWDADVDSHIINGSWGWWLSGSADTIFDQIVGGVGFDATEDNLHALSLRLSALPAATRDVDNTAPAANSLGAKVNQAAGGGSGGTTTEVNQFPNERNQIG